MRESKDAGATAPSRGREIFQQKNTCDRVPACAQERSLGHYTKLIYQERSLVTDNFLVVTRKFLRPRLNAFLYSKKHLRLSSPHESSNKYFSAEKSFWHTSHRRAPVLCLGPTPSSPGTFFLRTHEKNSDTFVLSYFHVCAGEDLNLHALRH